MITLYAITKNNYDYMFYGGIGNLFGNLIMLYSFANVGDAGEELIKAGEKLETENSEE